MNTADLITELLGPNWWEEPPDSTAACAIMDKLMEQGILRDKLLVTLRDATFPNCRTIGQCNRFMMPFREILKP